MSPVRRRVLEALAAAFLCPVHTAYGQQALKTLLMLDFELLDDQAPDVPFPEGPARLAMISRRLHEAFVRERSYEVIDPAPVASLIEETRKTQNLLDCNGCDIDIARKAGVDRLLLGWVQKVSNLILNINIEVRDATSGKPVLVKSVDLRGNTDQSWQRGIDYLVRDMVEKHQGNR
jgi:hypothetical protein